MRRWRREIFFLAVLACLSASSRATPVDDSKTPVPAEHPAFRSAINVMTTSEAKPSFFVAPPAPASPEFHASQGEPSLTPGNSAADGSSSANRSFNAPIQSEIAGPASVQSTTALTDSTVSVASREETTNSKATGTSGREFSLNAQGTPEPGSLDLLACGSLLLLKRFRRVK